MANTLLLILGLVACLFYCSLAAPTADDLAKFGELENSLKELATSVLSLSGVGVVPGAEPAEGSSSELLSGGSAGFLPDFSEFQI